MRHLPGWPVEEAPRPFRERRRRTRGAEPEKVLTMLEDARRDGIAVPGGGAVLSHLEDRRRAGEIDCAGGGHAEAAVVEPPGPTGLRAGDGVERGGGGSETGRCFAQQRTVPHDRAVLQHWAESLIETTGLPVDPEPGC